MGSLTYKPVGLALSAAGGVVAAVVFKKVWHMVAGEDEAPGATDRDRSWGEVLASAALQGLIFAVVKAAIDRGGAQAIRRLTGGWPD